MTGSQLSGVVRPVRIGDRRGLRLEPTMWQGLVEIARRQGREVNDVLAEIDRNRTVPGLTAAVRMYVVGHFRPEDTAGTPKRHAARRRLRLVEGAI